MANRIYSQPLSEASGKHLLPQKSSVKISAYDSRGKKIKIVFSVIEIHKEQELTEIHLKYELEN